MSRRTTTKSSLRERQLRAPETLEQRCLLAMDSVGAVLHDVYSDQLNGANHHASSDYYVPPRAFVSSPAELISKTTEDTAEEIAVSVLRDNAAQFGLKASDLDDYRVSDQYVSQRTGVTHVYLRQTHLGLDVIQADANVNVAADGRVLSAGSSFLPDLNSSSSSRREAATAVERAEPPAAAMRALSALANHFRWTLTIDESSGDEVEDAGSDVGESSSFVEQEQTTVVLPASGISLEPIPATLHYVPTPSGGVELAWGFVVQTVDGRHSYDASVSAEDGELLYVSDWGKRATYNVFPLPLKSPADGPRSTQTDAADATASPLGWHDISFVDGEGEFTDTRGNNARTQEDRDADNLGGFRPDGGESLEFDFPVDLTQRPIANESAAITNLFYQLNVLHDIHFLYGFDEAAGNFQEINLTGLGSGGDAIRADAQDGFDFNNAAFLSTPDGIAPRIQMGEWLGATTVAVNVPANLVGDFDAGPARFGPLLNTAEVRGNVVVSSPRDGCDTFTNSADIAGNIALVERGTCLFVTKVLNAQTAGAIAVIVTNHESTGVVTMAGEDPSIEIPSLFISRADGNQLRSLVSDGNPLNTTLTGSPNRDSSFDNGVIIHEYGHGVSGRLTGGPANAGALNAIQSAGLGEGWSDWWALMFTQTADDTQIGSYSIGTFLQSEPSGGPGIRRFPYSYDMTVNPLTYADIDEAQADVPCPGGCEEVHNAGEIWAAALWDLNWLLINGDGGTIPAQGFDADLYRGTGGNKGALPLIMDGLKMQPSNPTFLQARDAILAADQALTGGANQLAIWTAFARRGMGFSADDGGGPNALSVTEAFDLPELVGESQWFGDRSVGRTGDGLNWGDPDNWTVGGVDDELPSVGPPGDDVTLSPAPTIGTISLGADRRVNSLTFDADYSLAGSRLSVTSGVIRVTAGVVGRVNADLKSGGDAVIKTGGGALEIAGAVENVVVEQGTFVVARSATIENLTVHGGAVVILNGRVSGIIEGDGQVIRSGDFNSDGAYECSDMNQLTTGLAAGTDDVRFDLTGDGVVDLQDRDAWLELAGAVNLSSGSPHPLGDANLDGRVNAGDLNLLALSWQSSTSDWCAGDFNADGVVGAGDLNILALHWQVDVANEPVAAAAPLPVKRAAAVGADELREAPRERKVNNHQPVARQANRAYANLAIPSRKVFSRVIQRPASQPNSSSRHERASRIDQALLDWNDPLID